ncbi:MAG TPA: HhH-GPD-type base excision DNA repair protein [Acidimicrobiales bacterium]|nr:HhH-GPD-type base excision DNA repair protein [Acidimicrobiales bacterium]
MEGPSNFFITGDAEADGLLAREPLALLLGMMLDQQVPMEWAFGSPARLAQRLGGRLDAAEIAEMDPEALTAAFKGPPALHRYPGSMAKRAHELCRVLVDHYDGRAENVWTDVATGAELLDRLRSLPGFGDEKARIFVAVLAKRRGVCPPGWEEAAAPFSDDLRRSVADVDSPETLEEVRAFKKARKAAGKGKAD